MKQFIYLALVFVCMTTAGFAQPRPADKTASSAQKQTISADIAAKYEGGMFGYSDKIEGRLRFDDVNSRLVFLNKEGKEMFGIPYESVLVVYPQSRSVTSNTGNVVRHIPLPGSVLGGLIKEKRRYMNLQFNDPDADARGMVSFKIGNKAALDSAIQALGQKAGLEQRGDAYYRPRKAAKPVI